MFRNNWLAVVDPFEAMDSFEKSFFNNSPFFAGSKGSDAFSFGTDLTDEGDAYQLTADLPGFNKEDIHLDINNDVLTISAERHSEAEDQDKKGKYIRRERTYGSYQRSISLGDVDQENIKAKYDNGVLTLTMPKKAPALPEAKKIEIE